MREAASALARCDGLRRTMVMVDTEFTSPVFGDDSVMEIAMVQFRELSDSEPWPSAESLHASILQSKSVSSLPWTSPKHLAHPFSHERFWGRRSELWWAIEGESQMAMRAALDVADFVLACSAEDPGFRLISNPGVVDAPRIEMFLGRALEFARIYGHLFDEEVISRLDRALACLAARMYKTVCLQSWFQAASLMRTRGASEISLLKTIREARREAGVAVRHRALSDCLAQVADVHTVRTVFRG
jgi:hypothetical protein